MVGIPWIWMGVGWTIPFFFSPFRMAAKTIKVKSGPLVWSCEWGAACKIGKMDLTLRKLHLSEALNGWWNAFTFNKNMVLLPYTFMPCWRHAENITWCIPAEENIISLVLSLLQKHIWFNKWMESERHLTLFLLGLRMWYLWPFPLQTSELIKILKDAGLW